MNVEYDDDGRTWTDVLRHRRRQSAANTVVNRDKLSDIRDQSPNLPATLSLVRRQPSSFVFVLVARRKTSILSGLQQKNTTRTLLGGDF